MCQFNAIHYLCAGVCTCVYLCVCVCCVYVSVCVYVHVFGGDEREGGHLYAYMKQIVKKRGHERYTLHTSTP